ncbi:PAS domain-containing protein [Limimonas halophila]|uniref:PAS domain-containing protein n=1 Tax=Limimonas halophila TaxID=1082479 RepID=A0A1G7UXG7_9PROT|nr:PAS domain-containing protein [Limimonas halophila]SDG52197.1 PAS domain-containing protein [Limimonas halophila]
MDAVHSAEDFATVIADPDGVPPHADDQLNHLARLWFAHLERDALPSRAEIDPVDFPRLLPGVMLLDCLRDGGFRIRVAGAHHRDVFGFEPTGLTLVEALPDIPESEPEWEDARTCRGRCRPVFRDGHMRWRAPGAALRFQRLLLPIAGSERVRVTQLLAATRIYDGEGRLWR